jgi:hypothetical protein
MEIPCFRLFMSQFSRKMLVIELLKPVVNKWAYLQGLLTQLMIEVRVIATKWTVADSDQSNNPPTLISKTTKIILVLWCKILITQLMLVSFLWDWWTKRIVKGRMAMDKQEEIINKSLMEWYRMVKFNLDPKMPGNQLILPQFRMNRNKIKVLCFNHAVIKLKIWYLDPLLK